MDPARHAARPDLLLPQPGVEIEDALLLWGHLGGERKATLRLIVIRDRRDFLKAPQDQLLERRDPRGFPYFWIGGPPPSGLAIAGTDFHAVVNRKVSVTPIHLDLTGRSLLRRLKTWSWSLEADTDQAI